MVELRALFCVADFSLCAHLLEASRSSVQCLKSSLFSCIRSLLCCAGASVVVHGVWACGLSSCSVRAWFLFGM